MFILEKKEEVKEQKEGKEENGGSNRDSAKPSPGLLSAGKSPSSQGMPTSVPSLDGVAG